MKKILLLSGLLVCAIAAQAQGFATSVQRFSVKALAAFVPIPPGTPDALVVFAGGLKPGDGYSVTLEYQGPGGVSIVTASGTVSEQGSLRVAFPVEDATANVPLAWSVNRTAR